MYRLPARAMRRHDHFGVEFFQGSNSRRDDRLEERAGEMKPADHRMDLLYAGQFLGLSDRVDSPRVTTASEHHQAFLLDMHHHCLVVMDVRVFLPLIIAQRVVYGESGLKIGRTVNLSSH